MSAARKHRDPGAMSSAERIAEVGVYLAAGYRRLRLSRQNELDALRDAEAGCSPAVNGDGAAPAEEVA